MRKKKEAPEAITQYVAIYLRVSTDDQADSGLGIEAQRARSAAMSLASGYDEEIHYYEDAGVSGTKSPHKRKESAQLLKDIEAGRVKVVIVSSLDRLARSMEYIIELTNFFERHNVAFISCKEKFDTSTPQGKFVLHMFAALAELERGIIAQRTREALTEKGKIDGEKGGRLPYGYERIFLHDEQSGELKTTGVHIDPEKAEIVRLIFKLRAQKKSMQAIADSVSRKVSSPRGGKWYASGVREILLNADAYAGGYRGESLIPWPAILTTVAMLSE